MDIISIIIATVLSIGYSAMLYFRKAQPLPLAWLVLKPVVLAAEKKLNRKMRSKQDLIFRGFLLLGFVSVLVFIFLLLVEQIRAAAVHPFAALAFDGVLLSLLLSGAAPVRMLIRPHTPALEKVTQLSFAPLDESGKGRVIIAQALAIVQYGWVLPLVAALFLPLQGVFVLSTVALIGLYTARYGFHNGFAYIPAGLWALVSLPIQLITAFLLLLSSAVTPGFSLWGALRGWMRPNHIMHPAKGGWPLLVLAGGSGLAMGGSVKSLDGIAYPMPWIELKNTKTTLGKTKRWEVAIALGIIMVLACVAVFIISL